MLSIVTDSKIPTLMPTVIMENANPTNSGLTFPEALAKTWGTMIPMPNPPKIVAKKNSQIEWAW